MRWVPHTQKLTFWDYWLFLKKLQTLIYLREWYLEFSRKMLLLIYFRLVLLMFLCFEVLALESQSAITVLNVSFGQKNVLVLSVAINTA